MSIIRIILGSAALFFSASVMLGQPWMKSVDKGEKSTDGISFYEIRNAFNDYWKNKEVTKGKGYKQFRRWEYFMEPRVYPSGNIDNPAYQKAFWEKISDNSTDKASPMWIGIGPANAPFTINTTNKTGNGRINCVAFHPDDPDIIYAGAPSGGFWVSENGGNSWNTTTDQLSSIGVSDIVVDHADPDNVYIATGDGDHIDTYGIGIVKSTNGGQTWQPTALATEATDFTYFRRILMNPANSNLMFASSNRGIYRTTNGWAGYSLVAEGNFRDMEFHPANASVIYATTYSTFDTAGIYRSTNGGNSFFRIMNGIDLSGGFNRIEIAVTPDEPNAVFALFSDSETDGFYALYKSSDQGASWRAVYGRGSNDRNLLGWSSDGSDAGGQGWYDLSLSVSPSDADVILVGGVNLWKSTNGGESWTLSGLWYRNPGYNYVHADQHMLTYSPLNGKLYCGNDGGVYVSEDHGESWTDISDGLEILQSYKIGVSQSETATMLSGNQDNGTFLLKEGTWYEIMGGDGMECIIDPVDPNILYSTIYYGDIYKSEDGGLTFTSIKPSPDLEGAWVTPYVLSRQYHKKLLIGYDQVYRTVDGGTSWEIISDFNGDDLIVIRIAPSNENYIYATDWNNLWKTSDGGKNWQVINANLPVIAVTDIAISETDPNKLWISASGYDENEKVFYSANGGQSWTNYSQGLPNVPANCLLYQTGSDKQLYLGTDLGVFHRNARMAAWEEFNGNLPNVIVTELEIQEATRTLYAGTYGRGIWKLSLPDTFTISPTAIEANYSEACMNAEIMFTLKPDLSDFDSIVWDFGTEVNISGDSRDDTMYVSYPATGLKDVTVNLYSEGTAYSETYSGMVRVVENIEFEVYPKQLFNCSSSASEIYITGNYDLSFFPSEQVTQTSKHTALVDVFPGTLSITATHGTCSDTYELEIIDTPDDICEAQEIYFGMNGPFSNQCATPQTGEPVPPEGSGADGGCYSQAGWCQGEARIDNSVWFRFVVPESYPGISVETEGFDTQIAVYSANSCNDLLQGDYTLLAANDDYEGHLDYAGAIETLNGIESGDTLWIQVDGSYGGITGIFTITLNDFVLDIEDPGVMSPGISNIGLFPNPNTGNFVIEINGPADNDLRIDVLDVTGKPVWSKSFNNVPPPFTSEIRLEGAHQGIYLVRISSNTNVAVRKIFVE